MRLLAVSLTVLAQGQKYEFVYIFAVSLILSLPFAIKSINCERY